ncbi:MAG: hypothetical protein K6E28_09645 [Eubacterium sp.]|nr:hypothetical protein [Eubacterium sp.]
MFNKKVGVILTIALCAAAMTGCGKEAATSEAPKTATTEAVTEVTTEEAKKEEATTEKATEKKEEKTTEKATEKKEEKTTEKATEATTQATAASPVKNQVYRLVGDNETIGCYYFYSDTDGEYIDAVYTKADSKFTYKVSDKEIKMIFADGDEVKVTFDSANKSFTMETGNTAKAIDGAAADKYVFYNAQMIAEKAINHYSETSGVNTTIDKAYMDKNGLVTVTLIDSSNKVVAQYAIDAVDVTGREMMSDVQVDLKSY